MNNEIRNNCVDMWNAYLVRGCRYTNNDIPISTAIGGIPKELIGWDDAKAIHKRELLNGNENYHKHAYIHWYLDDQNFDGNHSGIWQHPEKALDIIRHFDGIISPDFSTFADFPKAIKLYNFYRMRVFDYWISSNGIPVVYNIRWGTEETWSYCWDGIPHNAIVAIGTVGSNLRIKDNRLAFTEGLFKMVEELNPIAIVVYGSAKYDCFEQLKEKGIDIIAFPSKTAMAYERRRNNE